MSDTKGIKVSALLHRKIDVESAKLGINMQEMVECAWQAYMTNRNGAADSAESLDATADEQRYLAALLRVMRETDWWMLRKVLDDYTSVGASTRALELCHASQSIGRPLP